MSFWTAQMACWLPISSKIVVTNRRRASKVLAVPALHGPIRTRPPPMAVSWPSALTARISYQPTAEARVKATGRMRQVHSPLALTEAGKS